MPTWIIKNEKIEGNKKKDYLINIQAQEKGEPVDWGGWQWLRCQGLERGKR